MCIPTNKTKRNQKRGSETQFPGKLHDMMSFVESQGLQSVISWDMTGRTFLIHDPEKLVELLPKFFSQTKYRSFRRQLNMWHFERILEGANIGAFHHPYFVRGNKALCSYMSRHLIEDHSYLTLSRNGMKIDSELRRFNASSSLNSLKTNTKLEAINADNISSSSQHGGESPATAGSFKDGDPLSFAGRTFFFMDSSNVSACSSYSTIRPVVKSLETDYFDVDKIFDDDHFFSEKVNVFSDQLAI